MAGEERRSAVMRWVVAAAGAAAMIAPAVSQQAADELVRCAEIVAEAERLACFDRAVGRREPAAAAVPPATSEPAVVAAPSPAPAASPPGHVAEAAGSIAAADEPVIELETETMPASGAEARSGLWRKRERETGEFSVLVVNREVNLSGLSIFVAEDGTIFEQVSARRGRYPDAPFTASMEPASRGSYWLTTEAGGRAVRVVERD